MVGAAVAAVEPTNADAFCIGFTNSTKPKSLAKYLVKSTMVEHSAAVATEALALPFDLAYWNTNSIHLFSTSSVI